ncbi:MAG: hypothetical protein QOF11_1096 [Chloroflexota bacterium]|jgi:hypothetical protein|nr:hypothetical protein [Chloroflexota bacterium]
MDRWLRRRGSRYGQWHHRAEPLEPAPFNRPLAIVAACGLILGQSENELERSDDPSDYAARCPICRALGPVPIARR